MEKGQLPLSRKWIKRLRKFMRNIRLPVIKAIFTLTVLVGFGAILIVNIAYIPRGYHLVKYLNGAENPKNKPHTNWIDAVTFPPMSEAIFRYTGNYCDAPSYSKQRVFLPGKNMTITILMGSLQDENYGEALRKRAMEELEIALSRCDPNASGPEMLPIHSAVIVKDIELISLLLCHGADPSSRINRPGKSADGLNALEFARFLAKRAKDDKSRADYEEIATLLEHSQENGGHGVSSPAAKTQ